MSVLKRSGKLYLVTGGSASGKSAFAEELVKKLAQQYGVSQKGYFATMQPFDAECEARIEKHRAQREGKGFWTVECYTQKLTGRTTDPAIGLLECMSNYVSNCMFGRQPCTNPQEMAEEIFALSKELKYLVVVSNEVFSDGKKYDTETQQYLEILAQCNRLLAQEAEAVYEVVCGIAVCRKNGVAD